MKYLLSVLARYSVLTTEEDSFGSVRRHTER